MLEFLFIAFFIFILTRENPRQWIRGALLGLLLLSLIFWRTLR